MLKRRDRAAMALLLGLALLLAAVGCASEGQPGASQSFYSFTDDAGRQVVLEKKPEKVAVLLSSYADIWQLAGGEMSATVGESVERGIAPEGVLLVDDGAGKTIDIELLLASEPDLVICSADLAGQIEAAEVLAEAGVAVAAFHVESFEDYLRVLKICADLTENPEAYAAYGQAIQEQIQRTIAQAQEKAEKQGKKRILFIRAGSSYSATKAKTADNHFACQMLEELGAENIADQAQTLLEGLSLEEILLQNPDYIFISTMGDEQAAKEYMQSLFDLPEWQQLDAVRQGNYAFLPKELFHFKPNAKWAEAYTYLAERLDEAASEE